MSVAYPMDADEPPESLLPATQESSCYLAGAYALAAPGLKKRATGFRQLTLGTDLGIWVRGGERTVQARRLDAVAPGASGCLAGYTARCEVGGVPWLRAREIEPDAGASATRELTVDGGTVRASDVVLTQSEGSGEAVSLRKRADDLADAQRALQRRADELERTAAAQRATIDALCAQVNALQAALANLPRAMGIGGDRENADRWSFEALPPEEEPNDGGSSRPSLELRFDGRACTTFRSEPHPAGCSAPGSSSSSSLHVAPVAPVAPPNESGAISVSASAPRAGRSPATPDAGRRSATNANEGAGRASGGSGGAAGSHKKTNGSGNGSRRRRTASSTSSASSSSPIDTLTIVRPTTRSASAAAAGRAASGGG